MKRNFKLIKSIIVIFLLFVILLTGFIVSSRKSNQARIDEENTDYKNHPKLSQVASLSPENIGRIKKKFIGESIRGMHHIPNEILHKGVVVTFGGSEGSINEHMAEYLTSAGYEVVAVYYFGQKDQPQAGESIEIELYEEIYSYILENCKNTDTITILGASKGAQLALLISTYYDSVDNLILLAPSAYITPSDKLGYNSSWTYKGEEIEYLNGKAIKPLITSMVNIVLNKPEDQLVYMEELMNKSTNREAAMIKVENSDAEMLLFYGGDDRMLYAKSSSYLIKEKAKKQVWIHGYEKAGHDFGSPSIINDEENPFITILNGGDIDSNIEADLQSKKIIIETLEKWHR